MYVGFIWVRLGAWFCLGSLLLTELRILCLAVCNGLGVLGLMIWRDCALPCPTMSLCSMQGRLDFDFRPLLV